MATEGHEELNHKPFCYLAPNFGELRQRAKDLSDRIVEVGTVVDCDDLGIISQASYDLEDLAKELATLAEHFGDAEFAMTFKD